MEEAERRRKIKTEEKVRRQDGDNPEEEKSDDVQVADSDKDDDDDVITLEDEAQSVAGSEKCDVAETAETKGDEEELVPQVTIGPDGNIVINQARYELLVSWPHCFPSVSFPFLQGEMFHQPWSNMLLTSNPSHKYICISGYHFTNILMSS